MVIMIMSGELLVFKLPLKAHENQSLQFLIAEFNFLTSSPVWKLNFQSTSSQASQ